MVLNESRCVRSLSIVLYEHVANDASSSLTLFFLENLKIHNPLLRYSLDFNYYGSWKVIETMDQKLVE